MYYWSKRLGLEEGVKQALEREELPSYWRRTFNKRSPLYLFNEIEKMKRPRKVVLKFPLTDALGKHDGAYIYKDNESKESKLVVRLGDRERLELPIPERALSWLKEKEREVEKKEDEGVPLKVHKTVRIQWREDKDPKVLKVQIVLRAATPT